LPLDAEGGYKSKLRSMLTNVPDKDIVFSLDTLDGKTDRSGAEEDLWNSLNEEHYQRCASASKETPLAPSKSPSPEEPLKMITSR
jgi:hypothetical protein